MGERPLWVVVVALGNARGRSDLGMATKEGGGRLLPCCRRRRLLRRAGSLQRGAGSLPRGAGLLLQDVGTLLRRVDSLLRRADSLLQSAGSLLQVTGLLLQVTGLLLGRWFAVAGLIRGCGGLVQGCRVLARCCRSLACCCRADSWLRRAGSGLQNAGSLLQMRGGRCDQDNKEVWEEDGKFKKILSFLVVGERTKEKESDPHPPVLRVLQEGCCMEVVRGQSSLFFRLGGYLSGISFLQAIPLICRCSPAVGFGAAVRECWLQDVLLGGNEG
ncbi:hypothetical protein MLD38_038784 [Melastoma candidum]|uniref:Uncharacterized protein n=1 Tax=Melastoma candidum TaxID=119954 RepID=A0ACB9KZZ8_9MYRT|nr:hypothetical protein MLD38_038784 [Melastoma candidum]